MERGGLARGGIILKGILFPRSRWESSAGDGGTGTLEEDSLTDRDSGNVGRYVR